MSHLNRVVILVDMDCFYCQVEEKLDPNLSGKPIAVVQYNAWKGGGIIAVNYPARDKGITRHMRGDEAKEKCPEIELVRVPNVRGKADLTKYRDAGKEVAEVLQTFTPLLERASVDEAYLDITEAVNQRITNNIQITADKLKTTHIVSHENVDAFLNNLNQGEFSNEFNMRLAIGGTIAQEVRAAVYAKTGFRCSAGIAHNKILAKLVCGLHKPNQQTILPHEGVPELFANMPVRKITGLGGKYGIALTEKLNIETLGELSKFTELELADCFDKKNAAWLYNLARGIDLEPVTIRLVSKSIGCCKKFPNRTALVDEESIKHWLGEFATEISERLDKDSKENNRIAKQMVISFGQLVNKKNVSSSKSCNLNSKDVNRITEDAYAIIKKHCTKPFRITFLGISVGKFEDIKNECDDISRFFKNCATSSVVSSGNVKICDVVEAKSKVETNSIAMLFNTMETNKKVSLEVENTAEIKNNINYESDDSISAELMNNENNKPTGNEVNEGRDSGSFFKRYFDNLQIVPKSPVLRNFDTSLNLGANSSDSIEQSEDSINDLENNSQENVEILPSTSDFNEFKEMCVECQKQILKTEMVSHMDYHFALKMVKDESPMYKPAVTKVIASEPGKRKVVAKKATKRKSSENVSKLTQFLVPNLDPIEIPTEICAECNKKIPLREFGNHLDFHEQQTNNKVTQETEIKKKRKIVLEKSSSALNHFLINSIEERVDSKICSECNNNIPVDEFPSHMDHHVAKKLHAEINPVQTINIKRDVKKLNKTQSVSSYFKPI